MKIKDLNDKYKVTMSTTNVQGGKAFATEQKIRELKNRILKIKAILDQNKTKISPTTITKRSAENMNNIIIEKYKLTPNEIEKRFLESERLRIKFNFDHIKISKKVSDRLDRYDKKIYSKKKLIEKLDISQKVLVLTERIKKKSALGKF